MLSPLRLKVADIPAAPDLIDRATLNLHTSLDGNDFDALVDMYLVAAVEWAEGFMHRTIISRAHEWVLRDFPQTVRQEIRLPRGRTVSVQKIDYARNGSTVTLTGPTSATPGTDYREDLRGDDGASLMPPRGESWPSVDDDTPSPVVVHFTAGWDVADVPQQIRHAVAMYVADAINNRGDGEWEMSTLHARQSLLSGWCLSRVY